MSKPTEKDLLVFAQTNLREKGFYTGAIDGVWGALSDRAWNVYHGQLAPHSTGKSSEPNWLKIARAEIGVREIPGAKDTPRILEYHQATSLKASDDETAWCAAFANWVLLKDGLKGTNSAMARSFLDWGVKVDRPFPGCIVVFRRGNPPQGHVAFYLEGFGSGMLTVLGGNQGDSVSIAKSHESEVLGYRSPILSEE